MIDREKVIRGLENCVGPRDCESCPYSVDGDIPMALCDFVLMQDALALLKADAANADREEDDGK